MMDTLSLVLIIFIGITSNCAVNGKELSTYGSDFYIGFQRQFITDAKLQIKIHTFKTNSVPFTISSKTGYTHFGITSTNSPATVTIPTSFQVRDSGYYYRNLGLHITSPPIEPISVIAVGYTSDDSPRTVHVAHPYLEQPTIAYTYYGISTDTVLYSQMLLIACCNNTTVTITPTQNISLPQDSQLSDTAYLNITAGNSHTVILHELQSLLIINSLDLSGTKIVSNRPLTVIGGHDCAQIPSEYGKCDPISTQIPPTVNWGNSFLLPPLTSRTNGQRYKIIASENDTVAEMKCAASFNETVLLFNDGEIFEFDTDPDEYCAVVTSEPVYIAEFGFGHDYLSDGYGDPLLMTIPPLEQYTHNVTFSAFETMPKNYYSILVPNDQYFNQTFLYNGFIVTPTWTTIYYPNGSIAGYGYSAQFSGAVTISHSNVNGRIGVNVYGFSIAGGYGYSAGMKFNPINIDHHLPEISFTKEEYFVGEGDEIVSIELERSVEIFWSVSVRIKVLLSDFATANDGADYISINDVINFQSGDTKKSLAIVILEDTYVEQIEYFILMLESVYGDVIFPLSTAIVTIVDNDAVQVGFTRSSVVTSDGETTFSIGILSTEPIQFSGSMRIVLTAIGPNEYKVQVCVVEFNYYAEEYTIKTNFSHIISAESHTDAASWIVQLSSDSPDINITLDPDQVIIRPEIVEPSSSNTVSVTCDSQGIPAYSLYIGIVVFIVLLVLVSTLAGILACLYFRERHKNEHIYDELELVARNRHFVEGEYN